MSTAPACTPVQTAALDLVRTWHSIGFLASPPIARARHGAVLPSEDAHNILRWLLAPDRVPPAEIAWCPTLAILATGATEVYLCARTPDGGWDARFGGVAGRWLSVRDLLDAHRADPDLRPH